MDGEETDILNRWLDWAARCWAIPISAAARGRILAHWLLVRKAAAFMNLTALHDITDATVIRLIVDSLSAARWYDGEGPAADVGSGAGYPGLVLAALFPATPWTLIESRRKKAAFLESAASALALPQVEVAALRAEEVGRRSRGRYAFVVARAVGTLPLVAELGLPLLREGGRLLAMRGPEGSREVESGAVAVDRLGGAIEAVDRVDLPAEQGDRVLVVVGKRRPTPEKFPRRTGALGRF